MIRINLLSSRPAPERFHGPGRMPALALILAATFSGLAWINGWMGDGLHRSRATAKAAEESLSRLERMHRDLQQRQQTLDLLENRIAALDGLAAKRQKAPLILEHITDVMPKNTMWFESLQTVGDRVKISGVAMSEKSVALFMSGLRHGGLFDQIKLATLQERHGDPDTSLWGFQLELNINRPHG